jgi:molybdate transport system substrate-binding protein
VKDLLVPDNRQMFSASWRRILGLAIAVSLFAAFQTCAQTLRVAVASDLQFAMKDLVIRYESHSRDTLAISYGSSGNFFTQIANGAPFDLFFSADSAYPQKLIDAGLADRQTLYSYAFGRLVLWAPSESHLDLGKSGFSALLDPKVQKIAIANPAHAPYGSAAIAALQKAGVYEKLKSKLVFGENISQTAQFVQSGNAQVGFVALSVAISPAMATGHWWLIPTEFHPALEQAAVVISASKNKPAAAKFLDFVKSPDGREILAKYGFTMGQTPESGAKP